MREELKGSTSLPDHSHSQKRAPYKIKQSDLIMNSVALLMSLPERAPECFNFRETDFFAPEATFPAKILIRTSEGDDWRAERRHEWQGKWPWCSSPTSGVKMVDGIIKRRNGVDSNEMKFAVIESDSGLKPDVLLKIIRLNFSDD
jgi:hypothetical protein